MPVNWVQDPKSFAPSDIDNSAYYSVSLNGTFNGQNIVNVLWYKLGLAFTPGGLNFFGAEHLATCVYNSVWNGGLKQAQSNNYRLRDITVVPFNGLFDPIYNLPFIREVNEVGNQSGATVGSAGCITCRFVLEPQILGVNGFLPPRRGYLSFGPIREIDIDDAGRLSTAAESFYETNLNPVSLTISSLPFPVTYDPIRMRIFRVLGVPILQGWTGISAVDVRPISSFRRSRVPEA